MLRADNPARGIADRPRRLLDGLALRLAVLYGLAVVSVMLVVSIIFYAGTVGVLSRQIDGELSALSGRLVALSRAQGQPAVAEEIERLLNDGIASETEIYLLAGTNGEKLVGNVAPWAWSEIQLGRLADQPVLRLGRPAVARVLPVRLADGSVLAVGRDLPDLRQIRNLVARAFAIGATVSMAVALLGAFLFHRRLEAEFEKIGRAEERAGP